MALFANIFVWIIFVELYQLEALQSTVIMRIGHRSKTMSKEQFKNDKLAVVMANLENGVNGVNDVSELEENDHNNGTLQPSGSTAMCPGNGELMLAGDIVRLQDLDCSLNVCDYKINSVRVYAMDEVVLDANVMCSVPDFQILSPKWTVVEERIIDLSGASGGNNIMGQPGAPGLPGSNGGNFIGIGFEFKSQQLLTLNANGGDGSTGQDGGIGKDGPPPSLPCDTGVSCAEVKSCVDSIDVMNYPSYERLYDNETVDSNEKLYYIYGQCGESGGDGGRGGLGGYEGSVQLFLLSQDPMEVKVQAIRGANGSAGFGGEAGNASAIFATCKQLQTRYWFSTANSGFNWTLNSEFQNDICDADFGQDGANEHDIQYPVENRRPSVAAAVTNYKVFVREKLLQNTMKPELKQLIEAIDKNTDIQSNYDTPALLNELYTMEEQYNKHHGEIDLVYFYESLARRIEEYSKNRKDSEKSNGYKKVLNYLFTAAWSKLLALRNPVKPSESTAEATARKLDQIDKELAINKFKDFFKNEIEAKEEEGNDFIYNYIIPEIEKISIDLESKLEQLLNEAATFEDAVKKRRLHYQNQLQKLRQSLLLRNIFSGLKTIGLFLGFLGPYGAVAQSVLSGTTQVVEFLVLDDSISITKPLILPPSIKAILANADDAFMLNSANDTQTRVIFKLDDILKRLNTTTDVVTNKKLEKFVKFNDVAEMVAFSSLERDIKHVCSDIREELLSSNSIKNHHIQHVSHLRKRESPVIPTDPIDPKEQKDKINDVNTDDIKNAIFLTDSQFKLLQEYEMKIQNSLIPLTRQIRHDLKEITHNLQSKSHVTLYITKWKVQSKLKDIRMHLQQATRGFRIENKIHTLFNRLDESVIALIKVFDQLQNYSDQKKFADFLANINSTPSRRILVEDASLQEALDKLEIMIMKNVLLTQQISSPPTT